MKKLTVIAVAVAAVMLFAIPAMALDVEFSGAYEAAGYYMDNTDLNNKEETYTGRTKRAFHNQSTECH